MGDGGAPGWSFFVGKSANCSSPAPPLSLSLPPRSHLSDFRLNGRQLLDERPESQIAEQLDRLRPIIVAGVAGRQIKLDGHVQNDAAQLLALPGVGLALRQRLLGALRRHLGQVRVDRLQRAVLLEQRHRALLADAPHAGDVVRFVPDQRLVVDELVRAQTVFLFDGWRIVDDGVGELTARGEHPDMVIHHLEDVPVAGDDQAVHAFAFSLPGKRREHIVRLEALRGEDRDVQRLHDLLDALDLRPQLVGHALAMAFVFGEHLVPKRLAHVEGNGHVFRLLVAQDVEEHRREAEHGIGQLPIRRGHGQRHRVKRPERQTMAVDQYELWGGHARLLQRQRLFQRQRLRRRRVTSVSAN